MMTKRYITNEVRTKLTESFKNEGFEYIKSKERIMRKHTTGFDVIYARIIDYNPLVRLRLCLSRKYFIRLQPVKIRAAEAGASAERGGGITEAVMDLSDLNIPKVLFPF